MKSNVQNTSVHILENLFLAFFTAAGFDDIVVLSSDILYPAIERTFA
jgi:hypothetical protein